jgi:hypothetical protein
VVDVHKDGDGLPPAQVLDGLLRLTLYKGKFESDAEYAKRLKTLSTAKTYEDVIRAFARSTRCGARPGREVQSASGFSGVLN